MITLISAEVFDTVLALEAAGRSQPEIAQETGISRSSVGRIIRGSAARPGTCSICGGPIRPGNATGICNRSRRCVAALQRAMYLARTDGVIRINKCPICGRPMKMNARYGICNRKDNPACVKAHAAARHAAHPEHNERMAARRAVPEIWCKKQIGYLRTHGLLVDLDVPYLLEQWGDGHCPVCRTEYIVGARGGRATSPSMDRVYAARGYRQGNVRIICMVCNRHKSDMSGAELLALAQDTLRAEAWADGLLTVL